MKTKKSMKMIILIIMIITVTACNQQNNNSTVPEKEKSTPDNSIVLSENVDPGKKIMVSEKLGDLQYGLNMNQVIDIMGTPEKEIENPGDNTGETYYTLKYPKKGIEIGLLGGEDFSAYVISIKIKSPCNLKTLKGIGIGSKLDDVRKIYKDQIDEIESNDNFIVVGNISCGMTITLENNIVKEIYIGQGGE